MCVLLTFNTPKIFCKQFTESCIFIKFFYFKNESKICESTKQRCSEWCQKSRSAWTVETLHDQSRVLLNCEGRNRSITEVWFKRFTAITCEFAVPALCFGPFQSTSGRHCHSWMVESTVCSLTLRRKSTRLQNKY